MLKSNIDNFIDIKRIYLFHLFFKAVVSQSGVGRTNKTMFSISHPSSRSVSLTLADQPPRSLTR